MDKTRVMVLVGTRPEAIKLLPLILELRASRRFTPFVVSTGQHEEMVAEILGLADVKPDVVLGCEGGGGLNQLFAGVVSGLERVCLEEFGEHDSVVDRGFDSRFPAAALVHGDTSSAAAAAVASFHMRIPVCHVEAGLRTHSTLTPFPEELNRQLIGRIAQFHLAPTLTNKENLIREGVPIGQIFVTGNTGIDALRWASELRVPYGEPGLEDLENDEDGTVVVITAHRRENWDGGLSRIAQAVAQLAEDSPYVRFVLPVHPNPLVGRALRPVLEGHRNVRLVRPMGYPQFARLLRRAHFAISDSGGIQEEAPSLGTPVLVTRDSTERQEGLTAGTLRLVGTDPSRIVDEANRLLADPAHHLAMAAAPNPYGDGHAADRIVRALENLAFRDAAPERYGSGYDRSEILKAAGFGGSIVAPTAEG
ncbi:non-hydrolyzing UDP-N-acetylglucosamine 2-epimerase [Actinocorallia longicatena]|uniref:UDP-N-acetylglucosamine 2-epimerase (non-hydrolyzing) n=1 Tax=Actinocorallia longicatena TaxID=111803 RepID=A0ABP6QG96_9ACTN